MPLYPLTVPGVTVITLPEQHKVAGIVDERGEPNLDIRHRKEERDTEVSFLTLESADEGAEGSELVGTVVCEDNEYYVFYSLESVPEEEEAPVTEEETEEETQENDQEGSEEVVETTEEPISSADSATVEDLEDDVHTELSRAQNRPRGNAFSPSDEE